MQTQITRILKWMLLGTLVLPQIAIRANAAVNLDEALDATNLIWSTIGSPAWEGQTLISHDGVNAAQSGAVADGAEATLQTTVNGPGTMTFWWKVSSEPDNDFLRFFISGVEQARVSGEVDWQSQTFGIPGGSQILKWTYSKSASGSAGLDGGWVDQVQFVPNPGCTYTVSPSSRTHGYGAASNLISISAAPGCLWNVVNTNAWITVSSNASGSGNGVVPYSITANTAPDTRIGTLSIGGKLCSISQRGMPVSDPSVTAPASQVVNVGGSVTFSVTASGSGPFTYQWQFNNVNLANGPTVSGATTATLSLANVQPAQAGAYRVVVTGAVGTATSTAATLTVNNGPALAAALDSESSWVWTTGALPWVGQTAVTHDGVDAASIGMVPDGSYASLQTVVTGPGTLSFWWKVSSEPSNDRLRFYVNGTEQSAISGEIDWELREVNLASGTQTLEWRYAKNSSLSVGQDRAWVDQVAFVPSGCTFTLSPTNSTHGSGSTTGQLSVAAATGCAWTVVTTNPWIVITSGSAGSGNGTVRYSVSANNSTSARTGLLNIGDASFGLTQFGAPCAFAVSPTNRIHGAGTETGDISVVTGSGCNWGAFSGSPWITILSSTNGFGIGTVSYRVAVNLTGAQRSGFITIAGQIVAVSQAAGDLPPTVLLGPVEVSTLGHVFSIPALPPSLPTPYTVLDYLIDQDQNTGGGGVLPSVSVDWDANDRFALTVSAPPGRKFMVHVPPGRKVHIDGFLWWESTRGGSGVPGTAQVLLSDLEGVPPNFSGASPVLSDSHGFFGFADLEGSTFTNDLAFTAITLTASVLPQFTGNGTEDYIPHHESSLQIYYITTETSDPGRFVSLVSIAEPLALPPSLALFLQPNGDVMITFSGTLQHATEPDGTFDDVPGNPQETYIIPKENLIEHRYFRARKSSP